MHVGCDNQKPSPQRCPGAGGQEAARETAWETAWHTPSSVQRPLSRPKHQADRTLRPTGRASPFKASRMFLKCRFLRTPPSRGALVSSFKQGTQRGSRTQDQPGPLRAESPTAAPSALRPGSGRLPEGSCVRQCSRLRGGRAGPREL